MNGADKELNQADLPGRLAISDRSQKPRALALLGWGLITAEFGMAQMVVQLLLAAAGLLIVRTLLKQEYALFIVCNSMQTTCNLFADWGTSIGLRSIGGRVWNDRYRFGQLLNTALGLRWQFALVSFVICLPLAG